MNIKEIIKDLITQFFIIFGSITILMTVMRSRLDLISPSYNDLYAIMLFSVLGALPSLILVIHTDVSDFAMKLRWVIHFIVLESVIIGFAAILKIVTALDQACVLFVEVAVVYIIVRLLDIRSDKKTSDEINEGLKRRKNKDYNLPD